MIVHRIPPKRGWILVRSLRPIAPWIVFSYFLLGVLSFAFFGWLASIVHKAVQAYWYYASVGLWGMVLIILGVVTVSVAIEAWQERIEDCVGNDDRREQPLRRDDPLAFVAVRRLPVVAEAARIGLESESASNDLRTRCGVGHRLDFAQDPQRVGLDHIPNRINLETEVIAGQRIARERDARHRR